MSTNILGNPETLRKFWCGPFADLMIKLTGEDGPEYEYQLNRYLRKQPCWENVVHTIDCDADPFVPDKFGVDFHLKQGKRIWSPDSVCLRVLDCFPEPKKGNDFPTIGQIIQVLRGRPTCNTNLLDYLLQYPYLIPVEWRRFEIYFFGTILGLTSNGAMLGLQHRQEIRCMRWHGINWEWSSLSDCNQWDDSCFGKRLFIEWSKN